MAAGDKYGSDDETLNYVLRVMTSAIILHDHVDPSSVFSKSSPVHMVKCIKILKKRGKTGLINSIRYSSRSFGNESTPPALKKLIEDA